MSLQQEIQVPLLAVNDTSLTVVELCFANASAVKKGDLIMVFETSKTTYDVEAVSDGYIQYLCEADHDYEVNAVVARIYSEAAEAMAAAVPVPAGPSVNGTAVNVGGSPAMRDFGSPAGQTTGWQGETLFSKEAIRLITEGGLAPSMFAGRDLITVHDVQAHLNPEAAVRNAAATGVAKAPQAAVSSLPVDKEKVIVERLSSGKKREIEYLGDVQSPGLTSTIHTFVETEGIFVHINRSLK
jgi:pyruvate/2-oxoglutarate dehydrogenase complex dihydrolipoamide acyltransferase (E2) component